MEDIIGNETDQTNKHFLKRFWWIFLILALIVVGLGVIFGITEYNHRKNAEKAEQKAKYAAEQEKKQIEANQKEIQSKSGERKLTSEELNKANLALSTGIIINDDQNDFAIPVIAPGSKGDALGRSDNTKPYSLGWNDLKKVTFISDSENFYVRYDFYGVIPNKMVKIGDDDIKGFGGGIILNEFKTKSGKTDSGDWEWGIDWVEVNDDSQGVSASWSNDYHEIPARTRASGLASPGEKDQFNETRYNLGMAGAYEGGVGHDYLIAIYPLNGFDILPGSEIIFTVTSETNSRIYHHSSIDPLLDIGSAKSGKIIHYTLGSKTYTTTTPGLKDR